MGNSASTDNQEQQSYNNNYRTNVSQQTQPQMRQNIRQEYKQPRKYVDQYVDQPTVLRPNYYNQNKINSYKNAQRNAQQQLNRLRQQQMQQQQMQNNQYQNQRYSNRQQQYQQQKMQQVEEQNNQYQNQRYSNRQQQQIHRSEHQPKQYMERPRGTRDTDIAINNNMRNNEELGMQFMYPDINSKDNLRDIEERERKEFEEREYKRKQEFEGEQNKRREYVNKEIEKFEREFNPYQILGLNKDCTERELKKSYKKLALKFHPDRNNGQTDNEFKIITQSYMYILKKLEEKNYYSNKVNKDVEYREYQDNINEQRENIYLDKDNFNLNKFNKIFDKYKMPSVYDKGYGDMMNTGNRLSDEPNVENIFGKSFNIDVFNNTFKGEKKKNGSQIIEYQEPQAINLGKNMGYTELGVNEVNNYGMKNEGLGYTDYRMAHHEENTLINPDEVDYKTYDSLNHLKADRKNISYNLSDNDKRRLQLREEEEKRREERRLNNLKMQDKNIYNQYNKINHLMIGRK